MLSPALVPRAKRGSGISTSPARSSRKTQNDAQGQQKKVQRPVKAAGLFCFVSIATARFIKRSAEGQTDGEGGNCPELSPKPRKPFGSEEGMKRKVRRTHTNSGRAVPRQKLGVAALAEGGSLLRQETLPLRGTTPRRRLPGRHRPPPPRHRLRPTRPGRAGVSPVEVPLPALLGLPTLAPFPWQRRRQRAGGERESPSDAAGERDVRAETTRGGRAGLRGEAAARSRRAQQARGRGGASNPGSFAGVREAEFEPPGSTAS